eukprot:SAG31_NODE_2722_length_5188_cov_6.223030_4_plen_187_part_00
MPPLRRARKNRLQVQHLCLHAAVHEACHKTDESGDFQLLAPLTPLHFLELFIRGEHGVDLAPLHFHHDTINVLRVGKKRWLMRSPFQREVSTIHIAHIAVWIRGHDPAATEELTALGELMTCMSRAVNATHMDACSRECAIWARCFALEFSECALEPLRLRVEAVSEAWLLPRMQTQILGRNKRTQ